MVNVCITVYVKHAVIRDFNE